MSLAKKITPLISEQDYLDGELSSEIKHEYIDGTVYAMAGTSENHNLISGNIFRKIGNALENIKSPCKIFVADMKVRISYKNTNYFYPDVVITCDKHQHDTKYYKHSPIIIVEVLSSSTRIKDKTSKKLAYFDIPTLQEYVLIEQDVCEITVFRKNTDWQPLFYFLGDSVTFDSIGATVAVEDIYYQVENEEIVNFLNIKQQPEPDTGL